jgi:Zn-finger domain associated with topoisomerase type I
MEGAFVVFFAVGLFLIVAYLKSPSVRGVAGEARVHSSLQRKLDDADYKTLLDLTLPTKRGTTQVDHIVLSRFGIFVIETKNMSGWIFGSADQARWTQILPKFKKQFQNPLRQNYGHVKAVQDLLEVPMAHVHNVVVFVGSAEPKTDMPSNVLWGLRRLPEFIQSHRVSVFTESDLRKFETKLRSQALEANSETRREHVKSVQARAIAKNADKTKCPRCNAHMVERTNRQNGEKFWGCSRYPKCRGTRK